MVSHTWAADSSAPARFGVRGCRYRCRSQLCSLLRARCPGQPQPPPPVGVHARTLRLCRAVSESRGAPPLRRARGTVRGRRATWPHAYHEYESRIEQSWTRRDMLRVRLSGCRNDVGAAVGPSGGRPAIAMSGQRVGHIWRSPCSCRSPRSDVHAGVPGRTA